MRHVLRGIAHIWRILPRWSSSEISIWGLILDTFGLEKAGCRLIDTVERPTSLNSDHIMKAERLTAYTTPLESSHRANLTVLGPFLGHFWHFWGSAEPLGKPVKVYRRHFVTADILSHFRQRTAGQNVRGATVDDLWEGFNLSRE